MRTLFRSTFLLLAVVTAARAQLSPEQVTALRSVTSVAMSADGRHVAYTLSSPRSL